ncbi:hypothetical protein Vretimale_11797 [Volvox reticuliferus]|uniref:Uncharacterized protein n=1 Tax=Volvox reticuliferus TaxID=1737510 RepID=A0A8J4GIJ6_9CHLO|nr:hypothetical protein Vretimale_11797 [Volvox reticuliferus]
MEPDLPPLAARAPARSSSLPAIPDSLKTTDTMASLLEEDIDPDSHVPEEALALRSAFVAYCRGADWRPQLPPAGTSSLIASISSSSGTINGGTNGNGLYASPSTQSLGGQSSADGTGPRGMSLSSWMRLWTDLGLPEGQGGPVPGSVLQTIHSAYRPHNSSRLNYVGFVQACVALSCQMQQNLLGAVGRHGAALQDQQRYQWRVHQATQAARNVGRVPAGTAVDEDLLFDSNLDLTPGDIAKEIAVISQLQVQLGQQQQERQQQQKQWAEGAAAVSGLHSAPAAPAPGRASWQPRAPPSRSPSSEPTFFTGELSIRSPAIAASGGIGGGRGDVGFGGRGAVKLPYAAGPASTGRDVSPPAGGRAGGGGGGGRRSPQLKAGKVPAGGWVRGGGGGGDAAGASPPPNNPYLQGLVRQGHRSSLECKELGGHRAMI